MWHTGQQLLLLQPNQQATSSIQFTRLGLLWCNSWLQTWPCLEEATSRGWVRGSAWHCIVCRPQKILKSPQHVHVLWTIITALLTLSLADTSSPPWSASFKSGPVTKWQTLRHIIGPAWALPSSQPSDPVTHPTLHIVRHELCSWCNGSCNWQACES